MSEGTKQFQSAKAKGSLDFRIDDQVFHRRPVTVESADSVAALGGQIDVHATEFKAEQLMDMVKPFIVDDDWERFDRYVRDYVEISTFTEIARWLIGEATGIHPSQPASSPDGSSTTGGPTPAGASDTASPSPLPSPSALDSAPASS